MSADKNFNIARMALGVLLTSMLGMTGVNAGEPEAVSRNNLENFRDMVLARCVARAYQAETAASADARSSANVLLGWTRYDAEAATDAIPKLIEKYLAREYSNPLMEYRDRRFNFLKCMDLYHGDDLNNLAKQIVSEEPPRK